AADTAAADTQAPAMLRCVDRVYTGQMPLRALQRGECIEIATGAPMPDGADAVVMVEDTDRSGDDVRARTRVVARQHIGRRGADISAGQVVVHAGEALTPARVGAIAATGAVDVEVFARPSV